MCKIIVAGASLSQSEYQTFRVTDQSCDAAIVTRRQTSQGAALHPTELGHSSMAYHHIPHHAAHVWPQQNLPSSPLTPGCTARHEERQENIAAVVLV